MAEGTKLTEPPVVSSQTTLLGVVMLESVAALQNLLVSGMGLERCWQTEPTNKQKPLLSVQVSFLALQLASQVIGSYC